MEGAAGSVGAVADCAEPESTEDELVVGAAGLAEGEAADVVGRASSRAIIS